MVNHLSDALREVKRLISPPVLSETIDGIKELLVYPVRDRPKPRRFIYVKTGKGICIIGKWAPSYLSKILIACILYMGLYPLNFPLKGVVKSI